MYMIPITKHVAPCLPWPGFYLQSIGHDYELVGAAFWLGRDPIKGLTIFTSIDEGYFAVLLKRDEDSPAEEWGSLKVWHPRGGAERWQLRARGGRPIALPGFRIWAPTLPAYMEKGGASCAVQG